MLSGRVRSCGCVHSREELAIGDTIESWGFVVKRRTRKILVNRTELDIYLPDLKLAIEYCGLYWHGETVKGRRAHVDKLEACRAAGVRLVTVFESEWLARPASVTGYLAAILGRFDTSTGARGLARESLSWSETAAFLDSHHIQGCSVAGSWNAGLRGSDGRLVAVASCRYGRGRETNARGRWELTRYCVAAGHRVVGGFQRLWSAFLREVRPTEVVSFSDRRWSVGGLYRRAGFAHDGIVAPSYWYFKGKKLHHKATFMKKKIETTLGPLLEGETEYEAMLRFGYDRIWDCGLDRWVWRAPDVGEAPSLGERRTSDPP